ncbi:MAG: TraB/GumN family protein [Muribaculaceae bacterium]|nr:TraB/GumN family protein [Muribaculaceae bacterium]MDE6753468.1 TraB/GumN family protein [Muribaculaceae bacterium]
MKKMKRFLIACAAIIGLAASANAQILYKVEKKGSDKVSYILGTHHFAPLAVVDSISELPSILKSVDKLYGELDMAQMSNPEVVAGMQQAIIAPADSTLDKVLDETQLAKLTAVWNNLTGGAAPLENMYGLKPSVLSTQIAAILTMKVFPELNPMEGIDATMQNRAKEIGKPVDGLETMDFQINMLYNRPITEQAEGLMKTIEDFDNAEKKSIELSNAYLNHDITTILKLMEEEEEDEATMNRMVYDRNAAWVERLAKEMPQESIFVVVGAAHIPGKKGVAEGLRQAGFKVTPVI